MASTSIPSSAPCRRRRSRERSSSTFFNGGEVGEGGGSRNTGSVLSSSPSFRPLNMRPTTGTLYVVATPLGNLGDLSSRAAEILGRVPVVAAEDTRRTRGLLSHLGVAPSLLSFHAHSGAHRLDTLMEILQSGRDVALVSDAGTPSVSDPGTELVALVRAAGMSVVPIPGASAMTTALSAA